MLVNFIKSAIGKSVLVAGLLASVTVFGMPRPASASTESTAAIVAAAALIVGAIAYDSSNRPYYVRDGRRWYVSPSVANYYRDNRWDRRDHRRHRRPH